MKISLWSLSVLCTGLTVGVLSAFIAAARKLTSRQQQWVPAFGVLGISLLGGVTGKLIFHLEVEKWTGMWSQNADWPITLAWGRDWHCAVHRGPSQQALEFSLPREDDATTEVVQRDFR